MADCSSAGSAAPRAIIIHQRPRLPGSLPSTEYYHVYSVVETVGAVLAQAGKGHGFTTATVVPQENGICCGFSPILEKPARG